MNKKKTNHTALMEQVAKISAETAVNAAIEYMEEQKRKEEKERRDKRLRNTKLLLKNYRSFVLHTEEITEDINILNESILDDMIEVNELAVESIRRSKKRTLAMVKFMNQMLSIYKVICENSSKPEDMRRYETVYLMYISEDKMTASEIAETHNIDNRTVYKDIDSAAKEISSLIFGVDGIRFVS
ncbi:HTH domain-containing protein [Cytobacillus sp. IB215665]|uniref:HTH domain-containing protein n=1 Tax=Cytobacillus sp. IB215665 TaxID=3097357 RepID=UPI002A1742F8|nr:HTH domain-containing protein [Cytobacillus sp. IB215665]MDX8367766.1 hypothetical protein [Cytobacillus sp. IB215665]